MKLTRSGDEWFYVMKFTHGDTFFKIKHKIILERTLPDALKLAIAQKIENNLFSKVRFRFMIYAIPIVQSKFLSSSDHVSGWVESNGRDQDTLCSRGMHFLTRYCNCDMVYISDCVVLFRGNRWYSVLICWQFMGEFSHRICSFWNVMCSTHHKWCFGSAFTQEG